MVPSQPPCTGRGSLFFSDHPIDRDLALALCRECKMRAPCLQVALKAEGSLSARGRYGIFGGKTPAERKKISLQASGRPPSPARQ